jgi:hypothetical protein
MNMEEWQRRVKAEKDAARKKKSESSELLHGYRGELRDEELKLKKLREEERQRQLDAERNLHSYQAKELEGIKAMEHKAARNQQPIHADAASSAAKDYMDGFNVLAAGSVSERAAAFSSPTASAAHTFHPDVAFDDPVMVQHPTDELREVTQEPVLDNTRTEFGNVPQDDVSSFDIDSGVDVNHTPTINHLDQEHTAQAEPAQTGYGQRGIGTDTMGEASGNDDAASLTKTNVLFSFGVVSIQNNPELFGYMAATEKVVAQCLNGMKPTGIKYDPTLRHMCSRWYVACFGALFGCNVCPLTLFFIYFVASYEPRSDKANTKRSLVTAGVPIFYNQTIVSRADTKRIIVTALQDAIQSGDFLQMAQSAAGTGAHSYLN